MIEMEYFGHLVAVNAVTRSAPAAQPKRVTTLESPLK